MFLLLFAVVVEGMVSAGTVVVVVHHHRVIIIILGGERGHFVHTRHALFLRRERLCFKDCDTRESAWQRRLDK